jgi:Squalene-hopene cyclase C-terminal domain/Prenyltransferase and squalene oxidase repeat
VRVRRALGRFGRQTPEWLKWITPWGTSLALHGLLVLALAVLVTALGENRATEPNRFRGQLIDDVTSGDPSDKPGDPFTNLQSAEPPSLSLDKNPPVTAVIAIPKLPDNYTIGPNVNTVPREPIGMSSPVVTEPGPKVNVRAAMAGKAMREGSGAFDARLPLMAPFSGRSGEERSRMIRTEGGTAESEKSVEMGLDWIARHQRPDGGWSLDTRDACKGSACPGEGPMMFSETAATGLALLPLLGAGHTHTKPGRYQKTIERGLFWLVKTQRPSGELFTTGSNHTHFYSHAIASMALCEAYGLTKDKRLRDPAQKAIFYLNRTQNKADGGWRYFIGEAGDTSVFGWQIFAMRSAHLAGLEVNRSVLKRAREYLDRVAVDPAGATYAYMNGRGASYTMTAEGLVCRQLMGWPRDHPAMLAGTAAIAANLEESQERNIYYWYYATQLLHNMRNKDWERWNARVREGLISMQSVGKECDRGSWDPSEPQIDKWGAMGGRLYTTSLSLLTLEVYYRYLPLYRDPGEEMPGSDRDPDETKDRAAAAAKK